MQYSKDQESALKKMLDWWELVKDCDEKILNDNQIFYLAGWAGTGKTTLANAFTKSLPNRNKIQYGSYTGKAALRMRQAGMVSARTLHSMIYIPTKDKNNKLIFTLNINSILLTADLLIVDEVSMVDEILGKDLLSFNKPILVLGDKGQIPPIKGQGFFTNRNPNATLTEVHRQALENPIIQLATDVRLGKPVKRYNENTLITFPKNPENHMFDAEQIICGKNDTRNMLNQRSRDHFGFSTQSEFPVVGDRIICLRNNRLLGLFNGMIGTITNNSSPTYINKKSGCDAIDISFMDEDDKAYDVSAHALGFTDEKALAKIDWEVKKYLNDFTWGFAITGHKSQGSQWDEVFILDDNFLIWDKANRTRWLYTCITRSAEKLVLYKGRAI